PERRKRALHRGTDGVLAVDERAVAIKNDELLWHGSAYSIPRPCLKSSALLGACSRHLRPAGRSGVLLAPPQRQGPLSARQLPIPTFRCAEAPRVLLSNYAPVKVALGAPRKARGACAHDIGLTRVAAHFQRIATGCSQTYCRLRHAPWLPAALRPCHRRTALA